MEKFTGENDVWNHTRAEISELTDRLEHPIESGVVEALTSMNLLGLSTDSSCEGHYEDGVFRTPYIQGSVKDMPFYRFVGQKEFTEHFLEENGLNDVSGIYDNDELIDKYDKLMYDKLELDGEIETEEYKRWSIENTQLKEHVYGLVQGYMLSESEAGRNPKITLKGVYPAYRIVFGDLSNQDARQAFLEAKEELDRFTEYLKAMVV